MIVILIMSAWHSLSSKQVYGDVDNLLRPTSAVFNIGLDKLNCALSYFSKYSPTHNDILHDTQTNATLGRIVK